jgi:hypothetical protein
MTNTVFASFSLPFLISLFYFSDASRRRTAMFVLVALSVALALIQYIYQAGLRVCVPVSPVPSIDVPRQLTSLYHPAQAKGALTPGILTSLLILRDLPNFVADLALSARLLAVYPPRTTPRAVLARVLGPALAVKLARAASMAVIYAYDGQNAPGAGLFVYWSKWERAWLIANRALTVVDNACVIRVICPCLTLTGAQVPHGVLPMEAQARVPLGRGQRLGPRQHGRRGCVRARMARVGRAAYPYHQIHCRGGSGSSSSSR